MNSLLRCTLLVAILISINTIVLAQSKDVKDIIALMRTEEEAWNGGDIDAYVNLYAPGDSTRMIYFGGNGVTRGKDSILAFYKKYWPKEKMGHLTLLHDSIEKISSEYYYVSGFFNVSYPSGKEVKGRFSGLVKKIKGKWFLYTDHSGQ
ncbi:MAG TPA: nuclear transport factor 2 family protein [Flavisolibacter sp.]|nr:nuclear transport factor 2 family protein [Flavisolibacter sp.]